MLPRSVRNSIRKSFSSTRRRRFRRSKKNTTTTTTATKSFAIIPEEEVEEDNEEDGEEDEDEIATTPSTKTAESAYYDAFETECRLCKELFDLLDDLKSSSIPRAPSRPSTTATHIIRDSLLRCEKLRNKYIREQQHPAKRGDYTFSRKEKTFLRALVLKALSLELQKIQVKRRGGIKRVGELVRATVSFKLRGGEKSSSGGRIPSPPPPRRRSSSVVLSQYACHLVRASSLSSLSSSSSSRGRQNMSRDNNTPSIFCRPSHIFCLFLFPFFKTNEKTVKKKKMFFKIVSSSSQKKQKKKKKKKKEEIDFFKATHERTPLFCTHKREEEEETRALRVPLPPHNHFCELDGRARIASSKGEV